MAGIRLDSPLQYVKGVGPGRADVLAQQGLKTVKDLLFYFPRSYLDRSNIVPIANVKLDRTATIVGRVKAHGILKGRKQRYEVILGDDTGAISLVWFRALRYWQTRIQKGQRWAATGPVTYFMGYQMIHPELEPLEEESDQMIHAGRIIPVYPQTSALNRMGLTSRGIRRLTSYIFEHLEERFDDPLPPDVRQKLTLPELHDALTKIHYPDEHDEIEQSRRRLALDELLTFQFLMLHRRGLKDVTRKSHSYDKPGATLTTFRKLLPFELTDAQKKVIREIFDDLQSDTPMSRLLQGDVGCGKTVVAVIAALYAAENNLQTAFMVPTEILAEQHYRNWRGPLQRVGVSSALLTSSLKPNEKRTVAQACAEGATQILFGTHALIYDYVSFDRLGLVIIDEQHRFGVQQRGKLYAKGVTPDLLVMTATPIPRTLALTLYGDLDISTIDSLPPGRQPTRTVWRTANVRNNVYGFLKEEIQKGGQVYMVYPVIEKGEELGLESVEDAFKRLSAEEFKGYRVGMVHGRMKTADRDETLQRFREGRVDMLLSTTVIEVGLDNPNATVMVVEHAERFGLAQLHQLRGRIGRGSRKATLAAVAHPPLSDLARQRLEMFASTTDGFRIAEADLELRGPGELFGVRQSGLPEFRVARLASDRDLIEAGRQIVDRLAVGPEQLDSEYRTLYTSLSETAARSEQVLGGG
ncbi:MAG: ATP-dependent DNA helicase RecG [Candidatus Zixiibacteriota bacterium]